VKYYVIHCEELPERTQACKEHLAERGIDATYWKASHGRTWGLSTTLEYEPGKHLPSGHVSLNLSTWNLWQHIWLSGQEWVHRDNHEYIIFEDDVSLPENYHTELELLQRQLYSDFPEWDLVFLGSAEVQPNCWNKVTERIGLPDSRLCRLNEPFGTHAIMLRRRALPVLLEHMRAAHRNLDQQLWERVLKKGLLNWCAVLPSIVTQRTFDYAGTGKPEWAPSCIDVSDNPLSGVNSDGNVTRTAPDPSQRVSSSEPSLPLGVTESRHHGDVQALLTGREIQDPLHITPEMDQVILQYSDPLPCMYRSEWSNEIGVLEGGRTIPLAKCGRYGDHCFTKVGAKIKEADVPVRSCETCEYRQFVTPDVERTRLPVPDGHFNCSVAEYRGQLILATRDSWGHSRTGIWVLQNTQEDWLGEWSVTAVSSLASKHAQATRLEDPRLFLYEGRLHASFSLPDGYPPKLVQVGYVRFADDLKSIEDTFVFESPNSNKYEKNWVAWEHNGKIHWVYAHKPEMIVMSDRQTWRTPNKLPWAGGVIRGGASPIKVWSEKEQRYEMWSIVHGCRKRLQGSVYSAGCVAFNPEPPFNVWRQTPTPLLWPDSKDNDNVVKRFVCWPGGAVVHGSNLFISLGVDDTYCRMSVIPLKEIDEKLASEQELNRAPSLIDTVLATGARK